MKHTIAGFVAVAALAVAPAHAAEGLWAASPAAQWSGLYFGGQAGYGMVDSAQTGTGLKPASYGADGAVGGLFFGYNHFLSGNLLAGVEVEGNLSDLNGRLSSGNPNTGDYYQHDWSAAARMRLGFLPAENLLLYMSAGVAVGHFNYGASNSFAIQQHWGNLDQTLVGLQLGLGAETYVYPNVSVRGEAVYTHFANMALTGAPFTIQPDTLMVRAGIAYHPGWLGQPQPAMVAVAPMGSWNGFYAGGQVGLTFENSVNTNLSYTPQFQAISGHAPSIGGHVGVNHEFGMWVAGLEADGALQSESGSNGSSTKEAMKNWSASVRARLGLLVTHNVLLYGTVGLAAAAFDYGKSYGITGAKFTGYGLQLGGGVEAFLTHNVSARIEGLYTDYGSHTIDPTGSPWGVTPRTLEARVGLTYHFN